MTRTTHEWEELQVPDCWGEALRGEFRADYFRDLLAFVDEERRSGDVYPPPEEVFAAFRWTPLDSVRVLILGQDPYHNPRQAHGLAFSVRPGVKIPPSLRNIYTELEADLGISPAAHGCLTSWAKQGVLLLNTVLTVRAHAANSHRRRGWERFTDEVIRVVNQQAAVAFVLWGKPAEKKAALIDDRHLVITSAHPSPLSARRGFFGSRPFSRINAFLQQSGNSAIDWSVSRPDIND